MVQYESDAVPDPEFDKLLIKQVVPPVPANTSSQLSLQIDRKPKLPQKRFLQYAKFDGTAQTGILTREFRIFVKMNDDRQRPYPIKICVIGTATIEELTGLICYNVAIMYPEVNLKTVKHYRIYMVEEDGEIEPDFPPLDPSEPCSKFCFLYLAIAPYGERGDNWSPSVRMEFPSFSMTSEIQSKAEAACNELKQLKLQQSEVNREMDLHNTMIEAPLYRSYRVYAKARLKYEVQLGVSGEKIEIDPVQQRNTTRFWIKPKAVSLPFDLVASCELLETKPNKSTFRILYSNSNGPYYGSLDTSTSAPKMFKHYDFETDLSTAQEIVSKVGNILTLHMSNSRRKYMAFCETRKRHQSSVKKKSGNKIF